MPGTYVCYITFINFKKDEADGLEAWSVVSNLLNKL
jgi:hypothetical protein